MFGMCSLVTMTPGYAGGGGGAGSVAAHWMQNSVTLGLNINDRVKIQTVSHYTIRYPNCLI